MLTEPSTYTSFLKHISMMLRELKKYVKGLSIGCQRWTAEHLQSEHSSETSSDDEPHPCEDILGTTDGSYSCECSVSMYLAGKLCAYCLWGPEKRDTIWKADQEKQYDIWLDRIQNCSTSAEQTSRFMERNYDQAPRSFFYPKPTDRITQHARSICELCTSAQAISAHLCA